MKMKALTSLAILMFAVFAAPSAFAQATPTCTVTQSYTPRSVSPDINWVWHFSTGGTFVTCTSGAAYQLEADVGAGGTFTLVKAGSPTTITAKLYKAYKGAPWGRAVNGEAISATGNGASQYYDTSFSVTYSKVPPAGTYTATIPINVIF